jgi:pilus assembly protein CpaE
MTSTAALKPEPAPIVACTISRNVQNFDLLIEDMESELGESWGDLTFEDASLFLQQPDSDGLEFVAIAMGEDDETEIASIAEIIKSAVAKRVKVLVIAEEVSPIALHQLLKLGAQEFVPYPLPDGALHDAIERMRRPPPALEAVSGAKTKATGDRNGVVLPVQGLAGGTGPRPSPSTSHGNSPRSRRTTRPGCVCSTSISNSGRPRPISTCRGGKPCSSFCRTRRRSMRTA